MLGDRPQAPAGPPRALYVLALVQLWERFACFATMPLLVLYLEQYGLSTERAFLLFGLLQALSYLSGLPGGLLADRWLGARLAALLSTALLALGYGALIFEQPSLLWLGLAALVAGHGLFKPGLNALVSGLYAPSDARRDGGFLIMHCAVNVGAAVAPSVAEWARARWGWAAIFQTAVLAMLASAASCVLAVFVLQAPRYDGGRQRPARSDSRTLRERARACWLLCGVAVVFWVAAMQASTSLTLFAAQNTVLHAEVIGRSLRLAPGHFLSLHALLALVLTPLLGWLLGRLSRRGHKVSTPSKMVWGFVATSAAFLLMGLAGLHGGDAARVGMSWLSGCFVLLTLGELLLAPMGLALVTRLAPPQKTSRMVALWFASTAVGNVLTGALGLLWTRWPHHRYFVLVAVLALGAAALLLAWLKSIERLLTAEQPPEAE